MALMKDKEILQLKCLIKNIDVKLSAVTDTSNQILCLVCKNNDLLLRYTCETSEVILKKVPFFMDNNKTIQDICFDPTGTWLLVFCK